MIIEETAPIHILLRRPQESANVATAISTPHLIRTALNKYQIILPVFLSRILHLRLLLLKNFSDCLFTSIYRTLYHDRFSTASSVKLFFENLAVRAHILCLTADHITVSTLFVSCKYRSIVCDTTELAVLEKASPSVR